MKRKYFNYKGITVNSFGIPVDISKTKKEDSGKERSLYNTSFSSEIKVDSPKNLIVIYDIPEEKKKERDWFRRHLRRFDFLMIQRSVWVGPSPLPKDFLDYVKSIGIKDNFKTFKLAKPYSNNNNHIS